MASDADLNAAVAAQAWYHTLDLPGGVQTPGLVDGRAAAARLPYPPLEGRRCLDIGTMNGFWAFEAEKRGASEVVALDIEHDGELDWPARLRLLQPELLGGDRSGTRAAFELARDALGSSVRRQASTVYDLSAQTFGEFDFVFYGSILLHLRDPVLALERGREVCRGEALVFDAVDPAMTLRFRRRAVASLDATREWWWIPNAAGLRRMIEAAGWDVIERTPVLWVRSGAGAPRLGWRAALGEGANGVVAKCRGFPHVGWRIKPVR